MWEVEVYGHPASLTPNLALTRAAVAASSVERADLPATAAVDGVGTSRWSSAFSDYQWLMVDLGAEVDIARTVIRWEAAYAARYRVQVSSDGLAWQPLTTVGGGDGGVDDLSVQGLGRYVLLSCDERATPWGFSIWEFEVYGKK